MTLEAALRQFLLADDQITAIVGQRVFWVMPPPSDEQLSQPMLILQLVSGDDEWEGLDADSNTASREYQITALAPEYNPVAELGDLIRAKLHFFQGQMVIEGPEVSYCRITSERDDVLEAANWFIREMRFSIVSEIGG